MKKKTRVLFICTHNAARSQMAEGIANHMFGERVEASSAGTQPGKVHPLAIKVMKEIGIDIPGQRPKHLKQFEGQHFDYAITLCSDAEDICPFFPEAKEHLHHGVNNPPSMHGSDEQQLNAFRIMRDDILAFIESMFS
ncbi:MAG: arsenate reductase ArsC [Methanomassiliicoccales archaeon]|nr:arsenate reductase ArsC [Methanomassiliicoccales archaeon]